MRVVINKKDPWFTRYPYAYSVFFNGVEIDDCILADEQLGLVEVYEKKGGECVIENDALASVFMVGSVKVKFDLLCFIRTEIYYYYIRTFQRRQYVKIPTSGKN